MELSGIRIDITIGDLEVQRTPLWWIESLRGYPLGRSGVTLPDPQGELHQTIKVGDAIEIEVGYRNQDPVSWSGKVALVYTGETIDQLEIRAIDGAKPLTDIRIVQAWENESPEAIVAWAIRQTGLPVGTIDPTGIIIPRFVSSNVPVWQLVRQVAETCERQFGLAMTGRALWLGEAGVNWSDSDEPGDVPVIATMDNLIRHEPATAGNAQNMIETFLLADLRHSRQIQLEDDRRSIDTLLRAQRVRHEGTPDTTRTFIWY
jgi:hypothetical protein